MVLTDLFDQMPFKEALGIELIEAENGIAVGKLDLTGEHSSKPNTVIAHGGVTYALADTIAGAAVVSANLSFPRTIDMRIDYLAPATGGTLHADAEVIRNGNDVDTVEVDIRDDDGRDVATARGTYKTGGGSGSSAYRGEGSTE